jgi:glucan phosphoethanolaminetransferase (alkaline phosphatase superfamily)
MKAGNPKYSYAALLIWLSCNLLSSWYTVLRSTSQNVIIYVHTILLTGFSNCVSYSSSFQSLSSLEPVRGYTNWVPIGVTNFLHYWFPSNSCVVQ